MAPRYKSNDTLLPSQEVGESPHAKGAYYEKTGAVLLSQESAEPPVLRIDNNARWHDMRFHLESRLLMMNNWRLSWWRHWALLAEFILPRRYHWLVTPNTMTRGFPINQNIVDPTGTQAMRVCSSGLKEGLTSPSRPWFKLKASAPNFTPDREAQIWFDDVEELIYSTMSKSNFYDSLTQVFEDITTFGTSPMIIYEDEKDIIRCQVPCAGEYYLAVSNFNRVEGLYRKFVMTALQIVEMFGLEACPPDVQQLWRTKGASLDVERIVCHAIEPNFPILSGRGEELAPFGDIPFPWREFYWVFGTSTERPLSAKGFYDEPFICPRWAITSNDPYGRSPAMDALPDIMQLQLMTKRKAEAIEKHVRPPLLASMDMQNQPSSALPGHVTYVANLGPQSGMRPVYEVTPQLQYMVEDIKQIQERVKKGFYNDIFMLHSDTTKEQTAYETSKRDQEKMAVLGPVIDRFQNEGAGPAIRRIYSILQRNKMLPKIPDSLRSLGGGVRIEYISILSQAQKAAATTAIERALATAGNMAATNPEVIDNFDGDETIRTYGELMSMPHRVFRDRSEVQKIRDQRRQQQQEMQQAQASLAGVGQAAQTAKVLSDTPVGGGTTALDMMMGKGGASLPDLNFGGG